MLLVYFHLATHITLDHTGFPAMDHPIHTATHSLVGDCPFSFLVAPLLLVDCTYPSFFLASCPDSPSVFTIPRIVVYTHTIYRNAIHLASLELIFPVCFDTYVWG